jgi:hypothetical protein
MDATHTETTRIAGELRKAVNGPAWHGPALLELLADVNAERAGRRPLPGAHSIWEIVQHVATWLDIVGERVGGHHRDIPDSEDWSPVTDESPAAWQRMVARVAEAGESLARHIERFADDALDARLRGAAATASTAYATLQGSAQHVLYHAGQVAVLKKG